MGRGDLSDEQWTLLEPLLPVTVLGRPSVGRRKLIDGIRWRVRTGAPWRDLPSESDPGRRSTDSSVAGSGTAPGRWCDQAAGPGGRRCRRRPPQRPRPEGTAGRGRHRAGRPRPGPVPGGFTTKVHLACEQGQRPLSLLVTAGQRGDSP
ncbi:transposase [Streptomyces sp. LP05-1]|uniref:Transposase n=1 Tax=Streptomyces pyxinae TaxID=2970734 RepID=A0ABT2CEV6_9ACTN|nr:transposase [Streptomyces sp. LP05-1]MCS0635930.1 transposase [Streptomyces sp. LP05-1]